MDSHPVCHDVEEGGIGSHMARDCKSHPFPKAGRPGPDCGRDRFGRLYDAAVSLKTEFVIMFLGLSMVEHAARETFLETFQLKFQ